MQHADWERELRRQRKNGVKENVPISRRINNREEGEDKELENPQQLFSRKEIEGENLEPIRRPDRSNQSDVRMGQWGRGHVDIALSDTGSILVLPAEGALSTSRQAWA